MGLPESGSCVFLHGRTKQDSKLAAKFVEPEHTSVIGKSLLLEPLEENKSITDIPTSHKLTIQPDTDYTEDDCDEFDDELYEDTDEGISEESLSFTKKRVLTLEENRLSGALKSELHSKVALRRSSRLSNNRRSTDPPKSLLRDMPFYNAVSKPLEPTHACRPSEPASLLQKITATFAWGRKNPEVKKYSDRSRSDTVIHSTRQTPFTTSSAHAPQATSAQTCTALKKPRPTLAEIIHTVCVPGSEHLVRPLACMSVRPAPAHRYVGYAVVARGASHPTILQRGFDAALSPPTPLVQKRNHSAGNLVDRNGSPWATWHRKNPNADQMPFARTRSIGKELDQHGGDEIEDQLSAFLEQAGDDCLYELDPWW